MVAVIAGNGLGLADTSLGQLGQAFGGQAQIGQGKTGQYLNIANGNLVLQNKDEGLVFDKTPLNVLRTYNSQGQFSGNQGWLFGFGQSIGGLAGAAGSVGSTVVRTDADGSAVTYAYDASLGTYVSTGLAGARDTLSWDAGSSTWLWTDGASRLQERYDADGRLTLISDPETGASYSFNYTGGRLSQIVADDGDVLQLGYDAQGRLSSLSIQEVPPGQTGVSIRQQVSYSYDAQGRLSRVDTTLGSDTDTSTASYITAYTYDGSSDRIASVSQGDGTVVSYTYEVSGSGSYRVTSIVTGTGADAQNLHISYGDGQTTVVDAMGSSWTYRYNASGELVQVVAPAVGGVSSTTSYAYDAQGNVTQQTGADGSVAYYSYDSDGNLLSQQDGAGNTISYIYNADHQVLTRSTYTVPAHGQPGQPGFVAASGARTSYYVYDDADRLRYSIDSTGAVTERSYSPSNGVVVLSSIRTYRSVLFDLSATNPSAPPSLAALQSWAAGGPVQQVLGQSVRVDYSYDVRGQLATQTQWDQLDANGNGVLSAGTVMTRTVYDAQGQLVQAVTVRGASRTVLESTSYAYDGLGRVLSSKDAKGYVTSYLYLDGSNTMVVTQANGLVTTQVRNSAGLLISSTQSSAPTSTMRTIYDESGRAVASIDAQGRVSYTFYDSATGRVTGTVSVAGVVTAYSYDTAGHAVRTVQYATHVDSSDWIADGILTVAHPSSLPVPVEALGDLVSLAIFDTAGHRVGAVKNGGQVSVTTYDAAGNPLSLVQYANTLTPAQVASLGTTPALADLQALLVPADDDQTSLSIYDADHHVLATVNSWGGVTAMAYDSQGNCTSTTIYSTPLSAAQRSALGTAPTWSALQSYLASASDDQTSLSIYDASNRVVAKVSASGRIVTTAYDAAGNVLANTAVGGALTSAQRTALGTAPTLAALMAYVDVGGGTLSTFAIYDAQGHLVGELNADGFASVYTYDANGNLIRTVRSSQPLAAAQIALLGSSPSLVDLTSAITTVGATTAISVYDASNRVVGTVDAMGAVTITNYDDAGNVISTIAYGLALTSADIQSLGSAPTLASLRSVVEPFFTDRITAYAYDDQHREIARIDPVYIQEYAYYNGSYGWYYMWDGDVTTTTYDVAGRISSVTVHANRISHQGMEGLATASTSADVTHAISNSSSDRTTLTIYDSNGALVAKVDPGYPAGSEWVTIARYDASLRLRTTTQYANALTESQVRDLLASPTLAALEALLTPGADDSNSYEFYDDAGHAVAKLESWGGVSSTGYDAQGRRIFERESSLSSDQISAFSTAPSLGALQTAMQVAGVITLAYFFYSDDGKRSIAVNGDGTIEVSSRDDDGVTTSILTFDNAFEQDWFDSLANGSGTYAQVFLLLSPQKLGESTISIFDDQGQKVGTVEAGQATITTFGSDGNPLNEIAYAVRLDNSQIMALSNSPDLNTLKSMVMATGGDAFNLTIRDDAGRVVATVDPVGHAVVNGYDAAGRLVAITAYAATLTINQIKTLAANQTLAVLNSLLVPGDNDAISLTVYGDDGRVAATVAADRTVTTFTYDASGHCVSTSLHSQALTVAQMHELATEPTLIALLMDLSIDAGNRISQTLYDASGRVVATVDGVGNVVLMSYDGAGNLSATIRPRSPLAATHGYFSSLDALLDEVVFDPPSDIVTLAVYDDQHRQIATVDQFGKISVLSYDATGELTATAVYNSALKQSQIAALGTSPTLAQVMQFVGSRAERHVYDAAGHPVASIDALGNVSYTFYAPNGLVAGTVDAAGAVVAYGYDAAGRMIQKTSYATILDTSGWLVDGVLSGYPPSLPVPAPNSADRVETSFYDASGRLVARLDAGGNAVVMAYDGAGNVVGATAYATPIDPGTRLAWGPEPTFAQLLAAIVTSSADRADRTIYDANNRVVASIDAAGFVTSTSYDAAGNAVARRAYANPLTASQLGSLGTAPTLSQVLADLSVSADDQVALSYFDGTGRLVAEVDAGGYLTAVGYDESLHTRSSTRYAKALSPSETSALNGHESVAQLVALLGAGVESQATTYSYDANDRLIGEKRPDGSATTYTYDSAGHVRLTTITDHGRTVSTTLDTYDAFGELTTHIAGDSRPSYAIYDAAGRPIVSIDAQGNSVYTYYDAVGRVVFRIQGEPDSQGTANALGNVTSYAYDAFGNAVSITKHAGQLHLVTAGNSGNGALDVAAATLADVSAAVGALYVPAGGADEVTTLAYTLTGLMAAMTDVTGSSISFAYDAFGEKVRETRWQAGPDHEPGSNDKVTAFTYDSRGEMVGESDAVGTGMERARSFQYDAFGRVIARTDALGNELHYAYDKLGRQVSSSEQVAGSPRIDRSTYDAFGRLLTQQDSMGQLTTYSYDLAARTTTITSPGGISLTKAYDALGDVVSVTDGAGNVTRYSYDGNGRLVSTTDALGNQSTLARDGNGWIRVSTDATGHQVETTYDSAGHVLVQIVDPSPNGLNLVTRYTYDGTGHELARIDPNGMVTTFGYDAGGHLLTQTQDAGVGRANLRTSYTYDDMGNVLSMTVGVGSEAITTTYAYDALNRLSSKSVGAAVTHYTYDAEGHPASIRDPNGNVSYSVYNEAGELAYAFASTGAQGSGMLAVSVYGYDGDGRLVAVRRCSIAVGGESLQALASGEPTADRMALASSLAALAHGPSDSTEYTVYDADGRVRYQVDAAGDVIETRYNALGQVAQMLAYEAAIDVDGALAAKLSAGTATTADLTAALTAAGNGDAARATYSYYDEVGRLVYTAVRVTLGGVEGVVVHELSYDAEGRILARIDYGHSLPVGMVGGTANTASIRQTLASTQTAATTHAVSYTYDAAGRQVTQTGPDGRVAYTVYDTNGNVFATVDPAGAVVQYERDLLGRVVRQTSYATAVDTSGWLELGAPTMAALSALIVASQHFVGCGGWAAERYCGRIRECQVGE